MNLTDSKIGVEGQILHEQIFDKSFQYQLVGGNSTGCQVNRMQTDFNNAKFR